MAEKVNPSNDVDTPKLSSEEQMRAALIFNRAQWIGWFLYFGAIVVLSLLNSFLSVNVFHSGGNGGWIGGLSILGYALIRRFAAHQVRRAGLSLERIERRTVARTATQFNGTPIQLRAQGSAAIGWVGILFCPLMLACAIYGWDTNTLWDWILRVAGGALFCLIWIGAIYLATKPLALLLDAQGVKGWLTGFWPRRASWEQIAALEVQQAFDYAGKPLLKTLVFVDSANTPLIKAPLTSTTIKSEQVDEFIAQVEAKLRGEA